MNCALEDFILPTQRKLFKRLCHEYGKKALYCKDNFILVRGEVPVLLVAHLDTVHAEPVKTICKSADTDCIWMSPQGIGGDDRCGVYALAKVYALADQKPWLLFTCDEEIGGVGAKMFCLCHARKKLPPELDELKFIIEVDRRGYKDAVYYDCVNPAFEEFISWSDFKTAQGSFSDISIIAPELGVAAVNLSCGYYNAHTLHEYIHCGELEATIRKISVIVKAVIDPEMSIPRFEYCAVETLDDCDGYFDDWDYDDDLQDLK